MNSVNRSNLAVALSVAMAALAGCHEESITETRHVVNKADGSKREDIVEVVRLNARGGKLIQQTHTRPDVNDAILSLATLDEQGFATGASYRREGRKGKRYVELKRREDGKLVVFSRGDDETMSLPDKPVVDLEMLAHLHAKPDQDVIALDVENATAVPARIDASGRLVIAPIARATSTDPVQAGHSSRAPFIESAATPVVQWCKQQASASTPVLDAAKAIALAVKPKLDVDKAGGPPSSFWTLKAGAWDEGGAALVVACLRMLEHPARVVTGQVTGQVTGDIDGALRTWAQVHDGARWVDVDPTDIDVDGNGKLAHHAVVEGFRGPLTTDLAK